MTAMNDFKSKIMSRFSQYKVSMRRERPGTNLNLDKAVKQLVQKISNFQSKMIYKASRVRKTSMIPFIRKKTHGTNYSAEKIQQRTVEKQGITSVGNSFEDFSKLKGPKSNGRIYSMEHLSVSKNAHNLFEQPLTSPDLDGIMESLGNISQEVSSIGKINRVGNLRNNFFGGKEVSGYRSTKKILPMNKSLSESQF